MKQFSKQPPRFKQDYAYYFLTFNTFKRQALLHRSGIPEFLIKELSFYAQKRLKQLIAYTIMANHIHLLIEAKEASELSNFLRDFKKFTSVEIKKRLKLTAPHIWQRGTMDHCIRVESRTDFDNHFNYIFYNSWKHLKILPKDFPYHNFKAWVDKGVFSMDFCDFDEKRIRYKDI